MKLSRLRLDIACQAACGILLKSPDAMKIARLASIALALSAVCQSAVTVTRINDPMQFVTGVYRRLMINKSYDPPEDIYTPRLSELFRQDRVRSKGEVGCLEFVFWVNGQDWMITNLKITKESPAPDRQIVIARFVNLKTPEEIHLEYQRVGGRWLLDEARSVQSERWVLSQILKCAP